MLIYFKSIFTIESFYIGGKPYTYTEIIIKRTFQLLNAYDRKSTSVSIDIKPLFTILEKREDQIIEHTELIKKSKFVVLIKYCETFQSAMNFIDGAQDMKASHNCWAYRSSPTDSSGIFYRSNDDGEPSGTAGRPILQTIESENLVNVAVLVKRYFGGIKLGTGGLIRAYGLSSKNALLRAGKIPYDPPVIVQLKSSSLFINQVYQFLQHFQSITKRNDFEKISEEFFSSSDNNNTDIQSIIITIKIKQNLINDLNRRFSEVCKGYGDIVIVS
eukprot:gene6128-8447_t